CSLRSRRSASSRVPTARSRRLWETVVRPQFLPILLSLLASAFYFAIGPTDFPRNVRAQNVLVLAGDLLAFGGWRDIVGGGDHLIALFGSAFLHDFVILGISVRVLRRCDARSGDHKQNG